MRPKSRTCLSSVCRNAVAAALSMLLAAAQAESLPTWFPQAPGFSVNPDNTVHEDYGRALVTVGAKPGDADRELLGHHWHADLYPAAGSDSWNGAQVWAALRAGLERQGFKVVVLQTGDVTRATLRRDAGGASTYVALVLTRDDGFSNSVEIVETAGATLAITLVPPAAVPEAFREQDDFPYLKPLPGARRADSAPVPNPEPLDVTTPSDTQPHLVGSGYSTKNYQGPAGLSNLAFVQAYAAALEKAGWQVLQKSEGLSQGGGIIVAHYDRNGRELWAKLGVGGTEWSAAVADVGQGLKQIAGPACRVAVYGINFDFDRATLRPDSEPVLRQVLALFKSEGQLKAEIGGHTDNVGQAAYNLKLSAGRADAVKAWLVSNGVAAARLEARGYGDTQPLVANDGDAHRARNRRVELKRSGCS